MNKGGQGPLAQRPSFPSAASIRVIHLRDGSRGHGVRSMLHQAVLHPRRWSRETDIGNGFFKLQRLVSLAHQIDLARSQGPNQIQKRRSNFFSYLFIFFQL